MAKLRQLIFKGITNSDLSICNNLSLYHTIGSPFYLGDLPIIKDLFTEEEMTMIDDDQESLPDLYIQDAINFNEIIKPNETN